jgi:protein SCO1/2
MLLQTFEVFILPDGRGGYAHNAALFVVNGQGDLIQALPVDSPEAALRELAFDNVGA